MRNRPSSKACLFSIGGNPNGCERIASSRKGASDRENFPRTVSPALSQSATWAMECEPREGCKRFQAEVKAGGEAEARGAVVLGGGDGGDGGAGKIMTTGGEKGKNARE